jgi:phosphoheptose isomerase
MTIHSRKIFSRQLEALAKKNDVVIAISTSVKN